MAHGTVLADGSFDFSSGVNSAKVSTLASELNPNGLRRNELAYLINATVRGGGILQRTAWQPLRTLIQTGLFQGGYLYEPDSGDPYLIVLISGRVYRMDLSDPYTVADLSATGPALTHPAAEPQAYFCQGENYLIIQAGDNSTLPLFWDGATLRRSKGITNTAVAAGTPNVNEIPAAGPMVYYANRIWWAVGRYVNAGDIVSGPSGTAGNHFRDAILNVTENPMVVGGDGFAVPTSAGNIRALTYAPNIDTTLGQGPLLIGTRKSIFALVVPVTRTDWIAADKTKAPQITVAQKTNGMVNDRSIVAVNSDLFFQSLEPAIRSHITARREMGKWGNKPISRNVNRILAYNNRALMRYASGIEFDNRLLQAVLPRQTDNGVVHQAMVVLDFDVLASLDTDLYPAWEGHHEGLDIFQLFAGDFGGRERAFAVVLSKDTGYIDVWELTDYSKFENGDNRVTWYAEFPSFTWSNAGKELELKELMAMDLWIDKLYGKVEFEAYYRPDQSPCWLLWKKWDDCAARNSVESGESAGIEYPTVTKEYCEQFRPCVTLPKPQVQCTINNRPSTQAYSFQVMLKIKGWCRIRGILLHAGIKEKALFKNLVS